MLAVLRFYSSSRLSRSSRQGFGRRVEVLLAVQGRTQDFRRGGAERGGGVPRSAKEANNPILLKVQSLQLSFRPAGVSLGGGGGPRPPLAPPCVRPCRDRFSRLSRQLWTSGPQYKKDFSQCITNITAS